MCDQHFGVPNGQAASFFTEGMESSGREVNEGNEVEGHKGKVASPHRYPRSVLEISTISKFYSQKYH